MSKAVIILSGGMDSTTLAYDLRHGIGIARYDDIYAVSFNYGQRHSKELECAKITAAKLGFQHHIVDMHSLGDLLKSALTYDVDVPEGAYNDVSQQQTVVPNRNMIMLSIAAGYAMSIGATDLFYGAHAGDHAIYPDCRPEFVDAMNKVLAVSHYTPVKLIVPYLGMSKGRIAARGHDLSVPYEDTWTCYKGEEISCGVCGSCDERLAAFREAGYEDPLEYASCASSVNKTHIIDEIDIFKHIDKHDAPTVINHEGPGTLTKVLNDLEFTSGQIDNLAKFIHENFEEEITEGGAIDVAMKSMTHWRNVAFDLWRLLDNIDAMDDMCKGDDATCRKMVNDEANKRHSILLLEGDLERHYSDYLKRAYKDES